MHRTPPDTAKRHKGKKPASRTPSISDTEREEPESPLSEFVDQTPRARKPTQTPTMAKSSAAVENQLQQQQTQTEATTRGLNQPVDPEERARQHELEVLKLQLQIEQVRASYTTPAPIHITLHMDKVGNFKKDIATKSIRISFKLKESNNYKP